MIQVANDSATKKATVVGLVIQDVLEAGRWTRAMAASGVVKSAVRVNPKHELRDAVGQVSNRSASASVVGRKEIKPLGGLLSSNATDSDHARTTLSKFGERICRSLAGASSELSNFCAAPWPRSSAAAGYPALHAPLLSFSSWMRLVGIEPTTNPLSGACLAATGYKSAALPVELQARGKAQRHMRNGFTLRILPC